MDIYLTNLSFKELIAKGFLSDTEYSGLPQNQSEIQNLVKPIDKPLHLTSVVSSVCLFVCLNINILNRTK